MTEDYKKNLIDYVIGNIQTGTPTTDEIIKEQIEMNRSDWVNFIPNNYTMMNLHGFIAANENTSNLNILYGGYTKLNSFTDAYGLIILVDNDFKPVKSITKFSSGTDLRYIHCLKQAEDNSFYMMDDTFYGTEASYVNNGFPNGQRRFVMLNNFTIPVNNDYSVNLRTSYNLGTNYNNFLCCDMFKNPNTSHYVFLGKYYQTYRNTKTISLKINVGSENEWSYINTTNYEYAGGYVKFNDDDNFYSRILLNEMSTLRNYFITGTKDYNSNSYTTTQTGNFNYYFDIDVQDYLNQIVFINENVVYFVGNNQVRQIGPNAYDKYIGLYKYDYSTNTLSTIYEEFIENAKSINKKALYICKNLNEIYLQYNNNIELIPGTGVYNADYYYQRLQNDTWNLISLGNHRFHRSYRGIFTNNKFNLTSTFLFPTYLSYSYWYGVQIKEIYNPTQYNGEPYESKDSLCPLYVNLYSNGSLVFSRNLYNISKQNNMSMSSVEIPNSYLNDATITQNDLIGETNVELVNDPTQWTKNIYEVVDLNFLNTISVIDEDTNTPYLESAIKVNNATTDGGDTNYQNTPCNKYRINYLDGTTSIGALTWNSINNYNKKTQITFYVDKEINSIDLISNDETTIYLTIPVEATIGSYYTINQKIRTGNKPTPVQLQYNNEDINYNNQPVMVYIEE